MRAVPFGCFTSQSAGIHEVLDCLIVDVGVALRDEEQRAVRGHRALDCGEGSRPADGQRHHDVRKEHDVAQWKNGEPDVGGH